MINFEVHNLLFKSLNYAILCSCYHKYILRLIAEHFLKEQFYINTSLDFDQILRTKQEQAEAWPFHKP